MALFPSAAWPGAEADGWDRCAGVDARCPRGPGAAKQACPPPSAPPAGPGCRPRLSAAWPSTQHSSPRSLEGSLGAAWQEQPPRNQARLETLVGDPAVGSGCCHLKCWGGGRRAGRVHCLVTRPSGESSAASLLCESRGHCSPGGTRGGDVSPESPRPSGSAGVDVAPLRGATAEPRGRSFRLRVFT